MSCIDEACSCNVLLKHEAAGGGRPTCNGDKLEDAQAALDPAVDGRCHHPLGGGPQGKQVHSGECNRHNVSDCWEDTQGTPAPGI